MSRSIESRILLPAPKQLNMNEVMQYCNRIQFSFTSHTHTHRKKYTFNGPKAYSHSSFCFAKCIRWNLQLDGFFRRIQKYNWGESFCHFIFLLLPQRLLLFFTHRRFISMVKCELNMVVLCWIYIRFLFDILKVRKSCRKWNIFIEYTDTRQMVVFKRDDWQTCLNIEFPLNL